MLGYEVLRWHGKKLVQGCRLVPWLRSGVYVNGKESGRWVLGVVRLRFSPTPPHVSLEEWRTLSLLLSFSALKFCEAQLAGQAPFRTLGHACLVSSASVRAAVYITQSHDAESWPSSSKLVPRTCRHQRLSFQKTASTKIHTTLAVEFL